MTLNSPATPRSPVPSRGWAHALVSAATFGAAGVFATPLLASGWSPSAAVVLRVSIGGLLLLVPAIRSLRGQWLVARRNAGAIGAFGLVSVAAVQFCYFNALQTLTVGIAILLEFQGILLVVVWLWLRHHQRPRPLTIAGTVAAIAGLVLVLDLVGGSVQIDVVGVLWGLGAAVGLAGFFIISSGTGGGLPPIALACGGLLTGAVILSIAGAVGLLPMVTSGYDVVLAGASVPWWVPVLGLGVFSAAIAYGTGIGAVWHLGAKLSAFVALVEVLFALTFAWLLLGQLPAPIQIGGGALIVVGVALVRLDELRGPARGRRRPRQA